MFGAAAADRVCGDANHRTMHAARDYACRQNKKTPLPSESNAYIIIRPEIPAPKTKSLSLIHPIVALHDEYGDPRHMCWLAGAGRDGAWLANTNGVVLCTDLGIGCIHHEYSTSI